MSKTVTKKKGCAFFIGAVLAMVFILAALVAGLAVMLMFAWSFIAPVFGLPLLDFPAAAAISGIVVVVAMLFKR